MLVALLVQEAIAKMPRGSFRLVRWAGGAIR
jgi:hypothetical protein